MQSGNVLWSDESPTQILYVNTGPCVLQTEYVNILDIQVLMKPASVMVGGVSVNGMEGITVKAWLTRNTFWSCIYWLLELVLFRDPHEDLHFNKTTPTIPELSPI